MQKLNRAHAPDIQLTEKVDIPEPRFVNLNGVIPLWLLQGGSRDIVKFELVFKAGSYHQDKPLQAFSAANLLRNGSQLKSSAEINKLLDFYGVSFHIEAQKDIITIGFFCLTRHFDVVTDLMLEMVFLPQYPKDEIDMLLVNRRQRHIINQRKIHHQARVHFNALLFGKQHPYGRILEMEHFDQLQRSDLFHFHSSFIHPGNCLAFLAGKYSAEIEKKLAAKFKKYENLIVSTNKVSTGFSGGPKSQKNYIPKSEVVQSALRIGKFIIPRTHPDFHKMSFANALLGGFFGSRLMRNVRQDKGYTYGISSSVISLLQGSYFFISTQVGKEVKEAALSEIYIEIAKLRKKPANPNELQMLKNYLSASFLRSFDGPFMQLEKLKEFLLFNLEKDHYNKFLPMLSQLSQNDIIEMSEKYFNENDMCEVVVG